MTRPLLSSEQLARKIGVCPETIRRWNKSGKIQGLRAGRLLRFRLGSVLASLGAAQTQAKAEKSAPSPEDSLRADGGAEGPCR